ncbi:Biogenesis of lysosome-related organelles complex 1 subunit 1 [Heracleum sosnowskyi]|uniref:Biogenesis of lysosome-related organelles complex 1 subunit 1 n=1 Tax=Heracleum sosnowskyi TaxID=360622 RepID=A0AAD8H6I3_9APIA|nr:Biogenesis of lysosome-related organelles complex 1 subunit 1 [Heracleum sosnowskyi]
MEKSSSSSSKNLEASLLQLISNHNQSSLSLKQHTDKAKKDAINNAIRVSDVLVESVNGGVEECYINQKRIELEIQALSSTVLRFAKQTDQWLVASRSLNNAVKEIGDFENWMKTMEFDCKSINAAIRNIHQV